MKNQSRPAVLAALIDERLQQLGYNLVEQTDWVIGFLHTGTIAVFAPDKDIGVAILINPLDPDANSIGGGDPYVG